MILVDLESILYASTIGFFFAFRFLGGYRKEYIAQQITMIVYPRGYV